MLLIICFSWGQCDYNVDGRLDSLDIVDGVNCLLIDCFNGPQCDFNSDGNIDIFDIYATIDCIFTDCWNDENLFALHSSIILKEITGSTFTMGESESSYQGPPGGYDAYVHEVTLSSFQISETEITNMQYAHFLNGAFSSGLIEVQIETNPGPNMGDLLIFGSEEAPEEYRGMALYNLTGTRVMKDHDNDDGDNDSFTGDIEPENPLNIAYIGYNELNTENEWFYVKDPTNPADFNWLELTDYYNYTDVSHQYDTSILFNDYDDWDELEDYPNNLPALLEVSYWPATFIKWYGAKAFTLFYDVKLPTEAQWEFASIGDAEFIYATADGNVNGNGTSAIWNFEGEIFSLSHVLNVKINEPNPYGLYNMAGNVWEWIEDWYASDYYNNSNNAIDPINIINTGLKVRRGGSWNYHQATLKTSARAKDEQFKGNDHFGFRIVQ
tara:strand:+ start:125 stop:1441 length:1317 start_codon:yes stop_codon:yes gene_type:complete